eukprot:CAMPEP_0184645746 /NCGR_PEP_ID=MMETSP0308-20130426/2324_1 /TAXON_ID=38269 /ORGANISM="Gloeochaete witrockiana, Strain SAG 46.84" /LENGTH=437 /DNA_ID=CAMNT_0027075097 /DNA_START=326 /DNA_END=1639 /DNA_ORIENTATION=+
MAFECPECGFRSNEVQSGNEIAELGSKITLTVSGKEEIDRQIIKADSASVTIPELDFEIPATTQRGSMSTVEGIIMTAVNNLQSNQEARREIQPDIAAQIDAFCTKLEEYARGEHSFTFILDDPAGKSYVQNPYFPNPDPAVKISQYERTKHQDSELGLLADDNDECDNHAPSSSDGTAQKPSKHGEDCWHPEGIAKVDKDMYDKILARTVDESREVMSFPTECAGCMAKGTTKMLMVDIPFFKETILMAFKCDDCGYKSTEVKGGGAISPLGKRITLHATSAEDLSRDVLKSETAALEIPEVELVLEQGTLGGRFTTVEGLLSEIKTQLEKQGMFVIGDSADSGDRERFREFIQKLSAFISGSQPFTLILDDAVANSYIQNLCAPDPDPNLEVVEYERTWQQNEELGLNDIKTEGYEQDEHSSKQHPTTTAHDEVV